MQVLEAGHSAWGHSDLINVLCDMDSCQLCLRPRIGWCSAASPGYSRSIPNSLAKSPIGPLTLELCDMRKDTTWSLPQAATEEVSQTPRGLEKTMPSLHQTIFTKQLQECCLLEETDHLPIGHPMTMWSEPPLQSGFFRHSKVGRPQR